MSQAQINMQIGSLKDSASQLGQAHPLSLILLVEDDEMSPEEFCTKLRTWLRLLRAPRVP